MCIREFFAEFPTDEACLQHLFNVRFGQGYECPKCDYKYETRGKGVAFVDGELLELTPSRSAPTHEERKQWYQQLRGHAAIKGFKPGWAFFKYQEKFKEEPLREWNNLPEMLPGESVKRWIKSRLIAFHKAKQSG